MSAPDRGYPGGIRAFATPVIDILAFGGYYWIGPAIVTMFANPSLKNTLLIVVAYVLLCLGMVMGRRIKSQDAGAESSKPGALVQILAWPFSIFVLVMMAETINLFGKNPATGEYLIDRLNSGTGLIITIPVFLIIMVSFPFSQILPVKSIHEPGSFRHYLYRNLAVFSSDVMMLITASYWEWQMLDAVPMHLAIGGRILVFVLAYIVFLMLYAPPRLALLSLESNRWSLTGYLVFLGYVVWKMTV